MMKKATILFAMVLCVTFGSCSDDPMQGIYPEFEASDVQSTEEEGEDQPEGPLGD